MGRQFLADTPARLLAAVIDEGVFAESGATEQVFSAPQNQITRQLLGEGV